MGRKTPKCSPKKQIAPLHTTESKSSGEQLTPQTPKKSKSLAKAQVDAPTTNSNQTPSTVNDRTPLEQSKDTTHDDAVKALVTADGKKDELENSWNYDAEMKKLMNLLECPYFIGEHEKAMTTFNLLEGIINEDTKWKTARELLDRVMTISAEIGSKLPHETTSRNVIYKIRKLIIDEFQAAIKEFVPTPDIGSATNYFRCMAMHHEVNMDLPNVPEGVDAVAIGDKVKEGSIGAMMEYRMELDNIPDLIARQGRNLIFEGDRVMTYAFCPNTAQLFLDAAKHCNFTLYVVESQPLCYGHLLLDVISKSTIEIILIPDCNIAALMPSMTKVIMPCVAVLFDGDLKTISYGGVIATVANMFKKEVYAVAATYQFTLPAVGNKNLTLSPYCIDPNPHPDIGYFAQKFDVTSSEDVFRVVTNSVHISSVQAPRHMAELYTPRQEKEET